MAWAYLLAFVQDDQIVGFGVFSEDRPTHIGAGYWLTVDARTGHDYEAARAGVLAETLHNLGDHYGPRCKDALERLAANPDSRGERLDAPHNEVEDLRTRLAHAERLLRGDMTPEHEQALDCDHPGAWRDLALMKSAECDRLRTRVQVTGDDDTAWPFGCQPDATGYCPICDRHAQDKCSLLDKRALSEHRVIKCSHGRAVVVGSAVKIYSNRVAGYHGTVIKVERDSIEIELPHGRSAVVNVRDGKIVETPHPHYGTIAHVVVVDAEPSA